VNFYLFLLSILFVTNSFANQNFKNTGSVKKEELSVDLIDTSSATALKIKDKNGLTVFQDQIVKCQLNLPGLSQIRNFQDLYIAIDKKYLLLFEKTLEREVLYSARSENYKLKVIQDKISILKIDSEGKTSPAPIDAKQKIGTVRGRVKQLLLNAKIEQDWAQYFEQRENDIQLEYSVRDSEMIKLSIKLHQNKQILNCEKKSTSNVCFCVVENNL